MPVTVAITIHDPPDAPAGYTAIAYEVRTYRASHIGKPAPGSNGNGLGGNGIDPIAVFSGTPAGFEQAARLLVQAAQTSLNDVGVGLRLAAVSWWVDRPMTECVDGRERLVSVYDAGAGQWCEWAPEERVGGVAKVAAPNFGRRDPGQSAHRGRTG